jgi:transcriptional regulator with XRE-family HTH domain
MAEPNEIEKLVRTRLRSLRNTLGLSLDELAERSNLSPSTSITGTKGLRSDAGELERNTRGESRRIGTNNR